MTLLQPPTTPTPTAAQALADAVAAVDAGQRVAFDRPREAYIDDLLNHGDLLASAAQAAARLATRRGPHRATLAKMADEAADPAKFGRAFDGVTVADEDLARLILTAAPIAEEYLGTLAELRQSAQATLPLERPSP
jgi:hypothetical protein